jgi:hypothetical protein
MPVESPLLEQVRFGWHELPGANELRVVLDLGSPDVTVARLEHAGAALRVLLAPASAVGGGPTAAGEAPATAIAPAASAPLATPPG